MRQRACRGPRLEDCRTRIGIERRELDAGRDFEPVPIEGPPQAVDAHRPFCEPGPQLVLRERLRLDPVVVGEDVAIEAVLAGMLIDEDRADVLALDDRDEGSRAVPEAIVVDDRLY